MSVVTILCIVTYLAQGRVTRKFLYIAYLPYETRARRGHVINQRRGSDCCLLDCWTERLPPFSALHHRSTLRMTISRSGSLLYDIVLGSMRVMIMLFLSTEPTTEGITSDAVTCRKEQEHRTAYPPTNTLRKTHSLISKDSKPRISGKES